MVFYSTCTPAFRERSLATAVNKTNGFRKSQKNSRYDEDFYDAVDRKQADNREMRELGELAGQHR